jgi:hypothetical protein
MERQEMAVSKPCTTRHAHDPCLTNLPFPEGTPKPEPPVSQEMQRSIKSLANAAISEIRQDEWPDEVQK